MKRVLLFLFLLVCAGLFFYFSSGKREGNIQSGYLAPGVKRSLVLNNREVTHSVRIDEGEDSSESVKSESFYVPPEGSFTYIEKQDGLYDIDIEDYGFTFGLYIGIACGAEAECSAAAAARLFYYKRWGIGAGYLFDAGPVITLERRVDDLLKMDNALLFLGFNKNAVVFGAGIFL